MAFFKKEENFYLGVDIGTTSIKVVELKKKAGKPFLSTYGFSENLNKDADWQENTEKTALILKKVLKDSGVKAQNAVAALPTFSVFSSVLNLYNVEKKEINNAVNWEAKKVIPLPLEEMVIDWKEIENNNSSKKNIKVLLTGAPKKLVKKYIDIFSFNEINLLSLETETFSLIRSLVGNDKSTLMLVEIGASTTDISVVTNKIPIFNRSIDVGGSTITKAISNILNIGMERAEHFKYDLGTSLVKFKNDSILKTITETISPIISEIKYVKSIFEEKNKNKIEKIILSGGSSVLPSLNDYLSKVLNMKIIIGDPWDRISCDNEDLRPLLNEIGPYMAVASGLALREVE